MDLGADSNRFDSGLHVADDGKFPAALQQRFDAVAHDLVVLDNQYAIGHKRMVPLNAQDRRLLYTTRRGPRANPLGRTIPVSQGKQRAQHRSLCRFASAAALAATDAKNTAAG